MKTALSKQTGEMFIYSWHKNTEEKNVTMINIYGLDKDNNTIVLKTTFTPYIYLELPTTVKWNDNNIINVVHKINSLTGEFHPVKWELMTKKRLYYANIRPSGKKKEFQYLFLCFSAQSDIGKLSYKIKHPLDIQGLGRLQFRIHESDATPPLQIISQRDIPSIGWIKFKGREIKDESEKETICHREFSAVKWGELVSHPCDDVARPLLLCIDIEANSADPSRMPNVEGQDDQIFQIACILARQGCPEEKYEKYLLSLGKPSQKKVGEDVTILTFKTEGDLLCGYAEFIREKNPNIIIGYNIFKFDIPYMIGRSKMRYVNGDFDRQGFFKGKHAEEKKITWSSTAFGKQVFDSLLIEGRIFVDMLPIISREHKLSNYTLKTVSDHFLGVTKDPLTVKGIFKCYRMGMKGTDKGNDALGLVGKYCVMDAMLPLKLFEKLQSWISLCEMAKTCSVDIPTLYTQGQTIKVYSSVYRYCTQNGIVVEKDGYKTKPNDAYIGAHVFDPTPGVYDKVVPFDFASLYPSSIIAYNIDWSTLIPDVLDEMGNLLKKYPISDDLCNVMEWEDHLSCEHDPKVIRVKELTVQIKAIDAEVKVLRAKRNAKKVSQELKESYMEDINDILKNKLKPLREERKGLNKAGKKIICAKRYYRFLKEPMGVLPTILKGYLDARKKTKKQLKDAGDLYKACADGSEKERLASLKDVLEARQLAYKISSNSGYGAMGVIRGYLPFMPGAMCTTFCGRKSIDKVAKLIPEKFGGKLIYGDSVTGDTPVLIKYPNDSIDILTIDDLAPKGTYKSYDEFKAGDSNRRDKEQSLIEAKIWTNGKWADINRVIRHRTTKKMFRILTHTGTVDVTEDHSLLSDDGTPIKPTEVKIGDRLLHSFPKSFEEFDTKFLNSDYSLTPLKKEEISFWTVFIRTGTLSPFSVDNEKEAIDFLQMRKIKYTTIKNRIYPDSKNLFKEIETVLGNDKKVPYPILNGSREDKTMFLSKCRLSLFKTKLACQTWYLLYKSMGADMDINIIGDVFTLFPSGITSGEIKKIIPLPDLKDDYVYDIETSEGVFQAGIGELVLKNTDSSYVTFPHLSTAEELWDYSEIVAKEISKLFPPPMSLAFEEKIYWRFLIVSKKRYMSLSCLRDGVLSKKMNTKGVLLSRRDNCSFVRNLYKTVIIMVFGEEKNGFKSAEIGDILYFIVTELNKMFSRSIMDKKDKVDVKEFVITKSVGDIGNLEPVLSMDEKTKKPCYKVGQYKVKLLSSDPVERAKQFKDKGVNTVRDYYLSLLQAHVQLAEKIRRRGGIVDVGTRLEYVITTEGGTKAKQKVKIESAEYYNAHSRVLNLDPYYYTHCLVTSIDQVLNILFDVNESKEPRNFMLNHHKFRLARKKVIDELDEFFSSQIVFN